MSRSPTAYDTISQSLPVLRGWAIVWIVAYHLMGSTRGYLDGSEAIATLSLGGLKNILDAGLTLFISAGSTGVNVFLVISGFGLTASWWKKYGSRGIKTIPLPTFWRKRVFRIFPLFWTAIAIATLLYWMNPDWAPYGRTVWQAGGLTPLWALLTTASTLRNLIPDHYYFLNGAWWYVGLSVQLYVIFPWLIRFGCRWGGFKLLIASLLFSLTYRAVFLLFPLEDFGGSFGESVGSVIPLAFFPSRLFEFTFGIYLAMTFLEPATDAQPQKSRRNWLKNLLLKPQFVPLSLGLFLMGLSFKWLPYPALSIFAEALIGVGLFCGLVGLSQIRIWRLDRLSQTIGQYSYGVYLIHMNLYLVLWPVATVWVPSYWLRFVLVLIACCTIGIGFDAGFTACSQAIETRLRPQKTI